jgi:dephospho-CoA kinase
MLDVGLTGGIASGKSTVARLLMEKGAFHVDFDLLAHEVEEPDRPAWKAIVAAFGKGILQGDRTIDRARLGAIVFQDREQLQTLNRIVHPAVYEAWTHRRSVIAGRNPSAIVLADVPLLMEGGMESLFDLVLLVYVSPEEQIRRLMTRNGYSEEEARLRLAAQIPIGDKVSRADIVLDNGGTLEETHRLLDGIWEELLRREREKGKRQTNETTFMERRNPT